MSPRVEFSLLDEGCPVTGLAWSRARGCLAVLGSGAWDASAHHRTELRFWYPSSNRLDCLTHPSTGGDGRIACAAWYDDGRLLIGFEHIPGLYVVTPGTATGGETTAPEAGLLGMAGRLLPDSAHHYYTTLAVSPDGSTLAAGTFAGYNARVEFWDLAGGRRFATSNRLRVARDRRGRGRDLAWSPDGTQVLVCSNGPEMYVLEAFDLRRSQLLTSPGSAIRVARWILGGTAILVADWHGHHRIWDSDLLRIHRDLPTTGAPWVAIDTAPGGDRLLVLTAAGELLIWNPVDWTHHRILSDQHGAFEHAVWAGSEAQFLTANSDGHVTTWDLTGDQASPKPLPPVGHTPPPWPRRLSDLRRDLLCRVETEDWPAALDLLSLGLDPRAPWPENRDLIELLGPVALDAGPDDLGPD